MKTNLFVGALAASVALFGGVASAATITVGTLSGTVASVDTTTGVVSDEFNPGVGSWFDIAINNAGTAYGVVDGSSLYSLDLTAETATSIGGTGAFVNALAFGSGGGLYGAGEDGLYSVDTATGAASLIGSGIGSTYTSSGDIAFGGGTTFYGTSATGCVGVGDCLWAIDSSTGFGTAIGAIGVSEVFGLGIVDDVLYGVSSANGLYAIDTLTGFGAFVQSYSILGETGGAAVPPSTVSAVPLPAALPLFLVGLGGLGLTARRKRKVT